MAWFENVNGNYVLCFRIGKERFRRSLNTTDEDQAAQDVKQVELNLWKVERGYLTVPPGADFVSFLLSDGRVAEPIAVPSKKTLKNVFDDYLAVVSNGNLEESTIRTIGIHRRHLERHFKSRSIDSIDLAAVQEYVNRRASQKGRHGLLSPATIRKEIATLKTIWNWGRECNLVHVEFPQIRKLKFAKGREKPVYMPFTDVMNRTKNMAPADAAELWECVFLTTRELDELLAYVKKVAKHPFIYPLFVCCGHTGARRSELARAMTWDVDLRGGFMFLRERKRDRTKKTTRVVPLSTLMKRVLQGWLKTQAEGYLFTHDSESLSRKCLYHHFRYTLRDSKWKDLRGFHTLRHGYVSALAQAGTPQPIIDELVSHATEDQRRRYRHLTPRGTQKIIASVFG